MAERSEHVPVLVREVCRALIPALAGSTSAVVIDATVGLGGHMLALLEAAAQASVALPRLVIGFDQDPDALAQARRNLAQAPCEVVLIGANFSRMAELLAPLFAERELGPADVVGVLADLGVSSLQLDRGERGFSWRTDAPLDMRMDTASGESAGDLLAHVDVGTLTRILRQLGEEPEASRIAAAIVRARPTTTFGLAEVVAQAMSAPARRKLGLRIHPATRTFQALRIHVNDELGVLDRLLEQAPALVARGGRVAIISFHSLEDRRVKQRFAALASPPHVPAHVPMRAGELPVADYVIPSEWKGGATAQPDELTRNPRSRSARLRVLERRP